MERPLRTVQRSIRLTEAEAQRYDQLAGYRYLWEFSELVRAGLELLWQAEQDEFLNGATDTGAHKRRQPKRGSKK